jgi:hypothetical protein
MRQLKEKLEQYVKNNGVSIAQVRELSPEFVRKQFGRDYSDTFIKNCKTAILEELASENRTQAFAAIKAQLRIIVPNAEIEISDDCLIIKLEGKSNG